MWRSGCARTSFITPITRALDVSYEVDIRKYRIAAGEDFHIYSDLIFVDTTLYLYVMKPMISTILCVSLLSGDICRFNHQVLFKHLLTFIIGVCLVYSLALLIIYEKYSRNSMIVRNALSIGSSWCTKQIAECNQTGFEFVWVVSFISNWKLCFPEH